MKIVALIPDLMDKSRLSSQPGAHQIEFVGSAALLPIVATGADLVLVDLSRPGVADVLSAVVESCDRVIGFAPHVEDATMAWALSAGAEVLPRSKFFRRAAELLTD
ncbi:unannotated protein [freshwater metagenome]|uniref:Unannotated protein n=1 Tax=freshwater metagenome TaxID=449393 RepID=A0A6J7G4E8_9ZZZZ|nr:hypothetical protein [Actinomycetota bacterium]MSY79117.1 hypothetical protein [Actinomycetota bacterium]MTA63184.1 hypothetical protein [Actinomycetota bacterium]